jgi:hypothetical protein
MIEKRLWDQTWANDHAAMRAMEAQHASEPIQSLHWDHAPALLVWLSKNWKRRVPPIALWATGTSVEVLSGEDKHDGNISPSRECLEKSLQFRILKYREWEEEIEKIQPGLSNSSRTDSDRILPSGARSYTVHLLIISCSIFVKSSNVYTKPRVNSNQRTRTHTLACRLTNGGEKHTSISASRG